MKENQKGSALLWAITVIMVLMILVAAALGISYSYYNRSVNNNSKRQAYLTAKGVIQNIVEKIELDNEEYIALIPEEVDTTTQLNIALSEDYNLGKITDAKVSKIKLKEDEENVRGKITISVTVDYAGQEETVNADMQLGRKGELKKWQLLKYYKGEPAEVQENINIKNAKEMLANVMPLFTPASVNDKEAVKKYLQQYPEYVEAAKKHDGSWGTYETNGYYSNDRFRSFLYYGVYGGNIPKFENSEASNFPSKFEGKTFYIKSYSTDGQKLSFIYANESSEMKAGDWTAYMIFDPVGGHWYDVTKPNIYNSNKYDPFKFQTELGDKANPDNELKKWEAFAAEYFVPERLIQ